VINLEKTGIIDHSMIELRNININQSMLINVDTSGY
jgi:hypothetical protein